MRSDASLKGKIKAIAKKNNLKPQELLQMYLFEHLLMCDSRRAITRRRSS